jgi:hypothetical protein
VLRKKPETPITRGEVTDLIAMIMGIDAKLDRVLDLLEDGHNDEEEADDRS